MVRYWSGVRSTAKEVEKQAKEYGEEPSDVLHQHIDGDQWIIYNAYHPWIISYTRNEDAVFDTVGEVSGNSASEVLTQIAFYAYYQDVSDAMSWNNPKHTRPEKPRKKKPTRRRKPYSRERKGGGKRGNPKDKGKRASGVRSLVSKALK